MSSEHLCNMMAFALSEDLLNWVYMLLWGKEDDMKAVRELSGNGAGFNRHWLDLQS